MFIRIKRRKVVGSFLRRIRKGPTDVDLFTLNFVVVQSVCTDKGPRQRVIKHVGSIAEHPLSEREVAVFYQYRCRTGIAPGARHRRTGNL